jgi:thiosulfate/3-mercaptopyruvate sulfurtransferase
VATEGRHPFPTPEHFAGAMSRLGIGDDTIVVAYDDSGGATAGRLVVMLRLLGRRAALLDGGLRAWTGELETGPATTPTPGEFTATPWPADRFATADAAGAHAAAGGAVLDARAAERFRGEVVIADARPGHIPGARSAPWSQVIGDDGRLRPRRELRDHFDALAAANDDVIAYCGSGVSACMNLVAMEHAGLQPARLFVASWSGWAADPERPAETGGA